MKRKILFFLLTIIVFCYSQNGSYILTNFSGIRYDYIDKKLEQSEDAMTGYIMKITRNAKSYSFSDNTNTDGKIMFVQENEDKKTFLIGYPEAIWTISIFKECDVAFVSVQRTMLHPTALFMHAKCDYIK